MENQFKYEVAFSFLQQDESTAIRLNDFLQDRVSTFVYLYHQRELAGNDGEAVLNKVFGRESRTVIILFRKEWGTTPWTRIEETAIKNRAFNEGYDYCLLIPVDDKPTIPDWFPKNRIWFDLERLGSEAATAIIEERIKERGGALREETIADRVARQQRKIAFAEKRKFYLESPQAVNQADQEAKTLIDSIEQIAISLSTQEIPLVGERHNNMAGFGIDIKSFGFVVGISWARYYSNSLINAMLCVRLKKRKEDVYSTREYYELKKYEFKFYLHESEQYGWLSKYYEKKFYTSKQLSDFTFKLLLDSVTESRLEKLEQID